MTSAKRSRNLQVAVTGDTRSFRRAMSSMHGDLDKTERRVGSFGRTVAGAFVGVGAVAGGAAYMGLRKSIEATVEAEKSQARLQAQLRASGLSFARHADEIDRVIQKHSRLAGLDDEELQDAFTNIIRTTGELSSALELTGLAADIARGRQMEVAKAGELVAKVAGGNIGILSRYGITLKDGATAAEAIAALQRKLAGQAEQYGQTTGGALDRIEVAVENVSETVGSAFAPSLERGADALSAFVRKAADSGQLDQFVRRVSRVADEGIDDFVDAFKRRRREGASAGEALADMTAEGFKDGARAIFNAAAGAAPKAVSAFLRGWWEADAWAKLLTLGFLMRKVDLGAFTAFGKKGGDAAAGAMVGSMTTRLGGTKAAGAFAAAARLPGLGFAAAFVAVAGPEIVRWFDREVLGDLLGFGPRKDTSARARGLTGRTNVNRLRGSGPTSLGEAGSGGFLGAASRLAGGISAGLLPSDRGPQGLPGGSSRIGGGSFSVAAGANRRGVPLTGPIKNFVRAVSSHYGAPLSIGTGSAHSKMTADGNVSHHWSGNAADIPASGAHLTRMGRAALVAAGMSPQKARRAKGGIYNIGDYQIIFNTDGHWDHLHLGVKPGAGGARSVSDMFAGMGTVGSADAPKLTRTQKVIQRAAESAGIDPALLYGIFGAESSFGKNLGPSPAGARGPFGLMPGTARQLGVKNPDNLRQSAYGAARYFRQLLDMFGGDVNLALAAYNAGPGNVKKHGGIPPFAETRDYVPKVKRLARGFRGDDFSPLGVEQMTPQERREWRRDLARAEAERRIARFNGRLSNATALSRATLGSTGSHLTRLGGRLDIAQSRAGLVDEDIADPTQRTVRIDELRGIAGIQLNVGYQQGRRLEALRSQARRIASAIKRLQAMLKRAPKGQRGVIRGRIRTLKADLKDIRDEARTLSVDRAQTGVDFDSTMGDIADVERDGPILEAERAAEAAREAQEAAYQPFRDLLAGGNAALMRAQVDTPGDASDDLAVLQGSLGQALAAYNKAVADNNSAAIIEFGGEVMSLRQAIEALRQAVKEQTDNSRELLELEKQKTAELQRRLATSEAQFKVYQQWLIETVGGGIGARVGLASASAGTAGVAARY